jgi:hypothetical protein
MSISVSPAPVVTTAQNFNLMRIALAVLSAQDQEVRKELAELNGKPLPSKEGWEKGEVNPEEQKINGRILSANTVLRKITPVIKSLRGSIESGEPFNVCQHCNVLFCWPRIIEHQRKNEPELDILCFGCDRMKG